MTRCQWQLNSGYKHQRLSLQLISGTVSTTYSRGNLYLWKIAGTNYAFFDYKMRLENNFFDYITWFVLHKHCSGIAQVKLVTDTSPIYILYLYNFWSNLLQWMWIGMHRSIPCKKDTIYVIWLVRAQIRNHIDTLFCCTFPHVCSFTNILWIFQSNYLCVHFHLRKKKENTIHGAFLISTYCRYNILTPKILHKVSK